jgi:hypothetical protein
MCAVVQRLSLCPFARILARGLFPAPVASPKGKPQAPRPSPCPRVAKGLGVAPAQVPVSPVVPKARGSWGTGRRAMATFGRCITASGEPPRSPETPMVTVPPVKHGQGAFLPPGPQTMPWRPTVRRLDARQRVAAGPRQGACHSPMDPRPELNALDPPDGEMLFCSGTHKLRDSAPMEPTPIDERRQRDGAEPMAPQGYTLTGIYTCLYRHVVVF